MLAIISARPPNAAAGKPPPIILPMVVRSGRMPNNSCAPPLATRNPVITSSKIKIAPASLHAVLSDSRKPSTGGTMFILPAIGSTITQAISSPNSAKARSTAAILLYSSVIVCSARPAGTPGELGTPSVSAPEPALINSESECP